MKLNPDGLMSFPARILMFMWTIRSNLQQTDSVKACQVNLTSDIDHFYKLQKFAACIANELRSLS